jgi:hypothetical protein
MTGWTSRAPAGICRRGRPEDRRRSGFRGRRRSRCRACGRRGARARPSNAGMPPSDSEGSSSYPIPPSVHWGVLLLIFLAIHFASGGIFGHADGAAFPTGTRFSSVPAFLTYFFVAFSLLWQAWFVRRISSESRAMYYLVGSISCHLLVLISGARAGSWLLVLLVVSAFALQIAALFSMKDSLERHYNDVEGYSLSMNGLWLVLLNTFYLQYHLRNIALWKQRQA